MADVEESDYITPERRAFYKKERELLLRRVAGDPSAPAMKGYAGIPATEFLAEIIRGGFKQKEMR